MPLNNEMTIGTINNSNKLKFKIIYRVLKYSSTEYQALLIRHFKINFPKWNVVTFLALVEDNTLNNFKLRFCQV